MANFVSSSISNIEDMVLWLKFDNDCLVINSACTNDTLVSWGKPYRLPKNKGLHRDWGAFFDFGDVLEVPGGL